MGLSISISILVEDISLCLKYNIKIKKKYVLCHNYLLFYYFKCWQLASAWIRHHQANLSVFINVSLMMAYCRLKLVANIWNNKIRWLWQMEYIFYFIVKSISCKICIHDFGSCVCSTLTTSYLFTRIWDDGSKNSLGYFLSQTFLIHTAVTSYLLTYKDGTDRGFWNIGI
jgi:hypothetical protein